MGYAMTTFDSVTRQPVIGFDMGGTSTDVSRFAGHYEHVYDAEVAGVTIQAPKLDITTVCACVRAACTCMHLVARARTWVSVSACLSACVPVWHVFEMFVLLLLKCSCYICRMNVAYI